METPHPTGPPAFETGRLMLRPRTPADTDARLEVEIGWRLRRDAWGRGLATEAAGRVLAYAVTTLGLPGIVADIDLRTIGSLRVADNIGLGPAVSAGWSGVRYAPARS